MTLIIPALSKTDRVLKNNLCEEVIDMTRFVVKSLMFISSYLPLYILLMILNWNLVVDAYYQNISLTGILIIGLLAALMSVSVITLVLFMKISTGNLSLIHI